MGLSCIEDVADYEHLGVVKIWLFASGLLFSLLYSCPQVGIIC